MASLILRNERLKIHRLCYLQIGTQFAPKLHKRDKDNPTLRQAKFIFTFISLFRHI